MRFQLETRASCEGSANAHAPTSSAASSPEVSTEQPHNAPTTHECTTDLLPQQAAAVSLDALRVHSQSQKIENVHVHTVQDSLHRRPGACTELLLTSRRVEQGECAPRDNTQHVQNSETGNRAKSSALYFDAACQTALVPGSRSLLEDATVVRCADVAVQVLPGEHSGASEIRCTAENEAETVPEFQDSSCQTDAPHPVHQISQVQHPLSLLTGHKSYFPSNSPISISQAYFSGLWWCFNRCCSQARGERCHGFGRVAATHPV